MRLIIPEPFYPNYSTFVTLDRRDHPPDHHTPEENYKFAIRERVEACINEHTRAILFTNPGNPTGTILTEEELRLMADIAKEHNLFLIGDEAYREFVYAGEPLQSFGEYADAAENIIVIDTVSKRFSACGARVGCILSRNHELLGEAMKYCQARLSVATLDQVASAALYQVGPEYFAAVREEYKRRRDTVVAKLAQIPGVICECPKGAFYIFINCKSLGKPSAELASYLLDEAKIALVPGDVFGPGGEGYLRLSFANSYDNIVEGCKRLAQAVAKLRQ